jgi:hypothetical protein
MAKCSRIGELEHLRQRRRRRQVWTFLKAKLLEKKRVLNATNRAWLPADARNCFTGGRRLFWTKIKRG